MFRRSATGAMNEHRSEMYADINAARRDCATARLYRWPARQGGIQLAQQVSAGVGRLRLRVPHGTALKLFRPDHRLCGIHIVEAVIGADDNYVLLHHGLA